MKNKYKIYCPIVSNDPDSDEAYDFKTLGDVRKFIDDNGDHHPFTLEISEREIVFEIDKGQYFSINRFKHPTLKQLIKPHLIS